MLKLSTATCCLMLPPPTSDEEPLDPALTAEPHLSPWEGSSALVTEAREAVCRGCRTSDSRIQTLLLEVGRRPGEGGEQVLPVAGGARSETI